MRIFFFKVLSISLAFIFTFSITELYVRYKNFGFDAFTLNQEIFKLKNYNDHASNNWFKKTLPVELDSNIGWKLKEGNHSKKNPWNSKVNIDENRFRYNPFYNKKYKGEKIIAFVGDSYTFGDGVDDSNTFPALFSNLIDKRTINAGVSGYGLDQIFLRSKQLINSYNISEIFLCFIPDNITRSNYSVYHGVKKPYYNLINSKLKLVKFAGESVPESKEKVFQKYGGYSLLTHILMMKFKKEYWLYDKKVGYKQVHDDGVQISIELLNQLKKLCDSKKIKLRVVPLMSVMEKNENITMNLNMANVLNNIDSNITILNIYKQFKILKNNDFKSYQNIFDNTYFHFSNYGNKFVAEEIFSKIMKL